MKHKVVLFSLSGARILTTDDVSHFQGVPNVAIDPDLEGVKGTPPHHWRLDGSNVVPVDEAKRTDPNPPSVTLHTLKVSKAHYAIQAAVAVGISLVISLLVKFL